MKKASTRRNLTFNKEHHTVNAGEDHLATKKKKALERAEAKGKQF